MQSLDGFRTSAAMPLSVIPYFRKSVIPSTVQPLLNLGSDCYQDFIYP
jgi:hypothetical protein